VGYFVPTPEVICELFITQRITYARRQIVGIRLFYVVVNH